MSTNRWEQKRPVYNIQIVHKSPTSVINARQLRWFFQYNQMHSGKLSHRMNATGIIYIPTFTINNQLDVGKHTSPIDPMESYG